MAMEDPAVDAPSNGANGRVTYRDVTDMMTRLERELRDGQSRLEGKIDAFILTHTATHTSEQQAFNEHLRNSAVMGERGQQINTKTEALEREVGELREWRAEVRGMTTLVKFAVGTSLVGAIVSGLTLLMMIQQFMPKAS